MARTPDTQLTSAQANKLMAKMDRQHKQNNELAVQLNAIKSLLLRISDRLPGCGE